MASNYTVSIKLDETILNRQLEKIKEAFNFTFKNLEVQLDPIKKATSSVTSTVTGKTKGKTWADGAGESEGQKKHTGILGKVLGKMEGISKSTMSLVGIGAGVGSLVALITESSPILQSVLKLFQHSVMMIFRPIGDFIGFLLRPLMILFMRNVALPLFQVLYPIMKSLGTNIGTAIANFFSDPVGTFRDALNSELGIALAFLLPIPTAILKLYDFFAEVDWDAMAKGFEEWKVQTQKNIDNTIKGIVDFFVGVGSGVTSFIMPAWKKLTEWAKIAFSTISDFLMPAVKQLAEWGSIVMKSIASIISPAIKKLYDFGYSLFNSIGQVIQVAWDKFVEFWKSVLKFLGLDKIAGDFMAGAKDAFRAFETAAGNAWKSIESTGKNAVAGLFGGQGQKGQTGVDASRYQSVLGKLGGLSLEQVNTMLGTKSTMTVEEKKQAEELQSKIVNPQYENIIVDRGAGSWRGGRYYTMERMVNEEEVNAASQYKVQLDALQAKAKERQNTMDRLQSLIQFYTVEEALAIIAQEQALGIDASMGGMAPIAQTFGSKGGGFQEGGGGLSMYQGRENELMKDTFQENLQKAQELRDKLLGMSKQDTAVVLKNVGSALGSSIQPNVVSALAKHLASGKGYGTGATSSLPTRYVPQGAGLPKKINPELIKEMKKEEARAIETRKKLYGFASGGIINEQVVGVGLQSGAGYTIGEKGSEVVIPTTLLKTLQGSGKIEIHYHIDKITSEVDLHKLDQLTKGSLLRAKVRKGVT